MFQLRLPQLLLQADNPENLMIALPPPSLQDCFEVIKFCLSVGIKRRVMSGFALTTVNSSQLNLPLLIQCYRECDGVLLC